MLASDRQPPVRGRRACSDKLLLFPSRVLTRSGSADPELTVSACVCFNKKARARHSDKSLEYIPFLLEIAGVLATFIHPNHLPV